MSAGFVLKKTMKYCLLASEMIKGIHATIPKSYLKRQTANYEIEVTGVLQKVLLKH